MRQEIDKLLQLGIIEPVNKSYVPYCSPCILVARADQSARPVLDYRVLNTNVLTDHTSFARIDDILTRIGAMAPQYFGQYDFTDSFFQIRLKEESRPLTTFTTEAGRMYWFRKVPMGLNNSPSALTQLTNAIFGHLDFVISYADDVICCAKTKEEYFRNFEVFLQTLTSDGLKLSLKKSNVFSDTAKFLGHIITHGTIQPLQKHLDAILKMERPHDKSALKRFLGSLNWLKKFVRNYSRMTYPLYKLLRKDTAFCWTDTHDMALTEIKRYLTTAPVIGLPTGTGEYHLYTDGSYKGLGASLLEENNGKFRVVGYASRATSSAETKMSVTELELSAIAFALKSFRHLLYGTRPIHIYTDHHSIIQILKGKSETATKRIASLVSRISEYDIRVVHIKGCENQMADMLSRCPVNLVGVTGTEGVPELRRSSRLAAKAATVAPPPQPVNGQCKPDPQVSRNTTAPKRGRGRPRKTPLKVDTLPSLPTTSNDKSAAVPKLTETNLHRLVTPNVLPERPLDLKLVYQPPPPVILPQPQGAIPVDSQNRSEFGTNHRVFLPENRHIFDSVPRKLIFADKFHGTVPERTRQKVRELATAGYKLPISIEQVREEQRIDPQFRDVYAYLKDRILPSTKSATKKVMNQVDNFMLLDGVLFKIPKTDDLYDSVKLRVQLVIPDTLANVIIQEKHEHFLGSGHAGFIKCLMLIKDKYHIFDLANRLKQYIDSCGTCLKLKSDGGQQLQCPLQRSAAKTCTKPWQRIQVDHCGPFQSNKYRSTHILVVVDEFSQFTFLYACDSTGAMEVVQNLNRLFKFLGVPSNATASILSDRGTAYRNQIVDGITKLYGIKWSYDTAASPWQSGLVEGRVKLVKQLARNVVLRNPKIDVFDSLADIQYAINNCPHSATGITPFFAMFGWDTKTPVDHTLSTDGLFPKNTMLFAENLRLESANRLALIKEVKDFHAANVKQRHDKSILDLPVLKPGDLVLIQSNNHPLSSKVMRKFKVLRSGPFKVIKITGNSCLLADCEGHVLPDLVSMRRLRKIDSYIENFPADRVANVISAPESTDRRTDPEWPDGHLGNAVTYRLGGRYRTRDYTLEALIYIGNDTKCGVYVPMDRLHNRSQ